METLEAGFGYQRHIARYKYTFIGCKLQNKFVHRSYKKKGESVVEDLKK